MIDGRHSGHPARAGVLNDEDEAEGYSEDDEYIDSDVSEEESDGNADESAVVKVEDTEDGKNSSG